MLAADCLNVGLFSKAICCSSSSVIVWCSEAGVCARPGKASRNTTQDKHSANRVRQRTTDTVSTRISVNFIGIVRLFMFVLHSRHVHLHWLIAFLLFSKLHDLVVLVLRQHAYERHHSRHKPAPAGTQAEVLRFVDHLIHRHHGAFHEGILRKAWHGIRIFTDLRFSHLHTLHPLVLSLTFVLQWGVVHDLFRCRTDAHSAT